MIAAVSETERRRDLQLNRLFGPLVIERMHDPDVFEIMLNPDGSLWEDRAGVGLRRIGEMRASQAMNAIRTVASERSSRVITEDHPILECRFPIRGARFTAIIDPLSMGGPTFSIRLMAVRIFTFEDYEQDGIATRTQIECIGEALERGDNMMIAGGTSSGKTTFANACLHHVAIKRPDQRVVIVEELPELQCQSPNLVSLLTDGTHDLTRMVRTCMRLRPDRIVVGEVRGGEALALLKAMNTGHRGMLFTIHANTARSSLTRLEQVIAEATTANKKAEIAEAIQVIVSIAKVADEDGVERRRIREVVRVDGYGNRNYILRKVA